MTDQFNEMNSNNEIIEEIISVEDENASKEDGVTSEDSHEEDDKTSTEQSDELNVEDAELNESESKSLKLLDKIYEAAMKGVPKISPPVDDLVYDYWKQFKCLPEDEARCSKEEFLHRRVAAIKRMQSNQIAKCTTTGILTGVGGAFLLPVMLPADLMETLYIQLRMVAATAIMAGCDPHCDDFKTHVYVSWAGIKIAKQFAPKVAVFSSKVVGAQLLKISGSTLRAISKQIGIKLTKSAIKSAVKAGKFIPVLGSIIGGTFNFAETKIVAKRAYKYYVVENPDFEYIRV